MKSTVVHRLFWARALRAFGDGYVSLLLPAYLTLVGMNAFEVGAIATGTLIGSGALTLLVGLHAYRFDERTLLLAATALMAATGFGFAVLTDFWPLFVVAVVGTLNPSSGDVSVFLPLEHAVLARAVDDRRRTASFARYSLIGASVAALGALFAAVPGLVAGQAGVTIKTALQAMFVAYGASGLLAAAIYKGLPSATASAENPVAAPLRKARKKVFLLAALFSLDAFGGGFIVQSMIALWLFEKYALSLALAATIFFWTGLLSALSYLAAARIADRFGLINTMVFTHLPSNVLLILVPLMPNLESAVGLLLARAALSQLDVPTRSSYVMAIVPPEERAAAASVTSVPRSLAAAIGPVLAGSLLTASPFGWPLVIAGVLKIVYDLLLLKTFRTVRPPEELPPASPRV